MDRVLLVHISDIHIGSGVIGTSVSSRPLRSGLNGHELLLCEQLEVALQDVRLRDFPLEGEERLHYVVSGDLTRVGSDNDFFLAYSFLLQGERLSTPDLVSRQATGLQVLAGDLCSVPGNHDHWNGYAGRFNMHPPAYNPAVFPRFFEATPWQRAIPSSGGGMTLELFGVDSNEGLRGQTTNLRARGVLSPVELNGLVQQLHKSQQDEKQDGKPRVRAVVCHHAFSYAGGLFDAMPLDPPSLHALLTIAGQYGVRAVLTGHTHYFETCPYLAPPPSRSIWELRSASTAQMAPQPEPQGFFVHVIEMKDGRRTWQAWKYQRDARSAGFSRNPHPVTFPC